MKNYQKIIFIDFPSFVCLYRVKKQLGFKNECRVCCKFQIEVIQNHDTTIEYHGKSTSLSINEMISPKESTIAKNCSNESC